MKKSIFLASLLASVLGLAQSKASRWSDWFSYNNVVAVREDNGKFIAATENGLFYYTLASGEITKLSKANGLHSVNITAFDYNPETKIGIIGYADGMLDVVTSQGVSLVVDIPLASSFAGSRAIRHISITGGKAIISADYGISIFDLERKEFGDSVFMSGVRESVLRGNILYTATTSGIKKHALDTTFPIESTWTTLHAGAFTHMDIDGDLVAFSSNNAVWYGTDENFSQIAQSFSEINDIAINGQNISVVDKESVKVFANQSLVAETSLETSANTAWYSEGIFVGSKYSGLINPQNISIKPDGPYANRTYKINLVEDKILVSTGARTARYNTPFTDARNLGFYFYDGNQWIYPSYFINNQFADSKTSFNVLDVVSAPNTNDFFFANYSLSVGQGIYRMTYNPANKDFDFEKFYSTGTSIYTNRPVGFTFDEQGNLYGALAFMSDDNSSVSNGYVVLNKSTDEFQRKLISGNVGTQKPLFYGDRLWLPDSRRSNLTATHLHKTPLNVNDDTTSYITVGNNLPASLGGVISLAFDQSGDAWIGTDKGLRILSNAEDEVDRNPKTEPIIITQNNLGEELFRDMEILQIEVDGGNQKWVSVTGGGVYYLSADGQQTIHHFTKENSPLPSNEVTDIKVDNRTGKVYFATNNGIMVYNGDVAEVGTGFKDVLVYPNPVVYANYKGNVQLRGLAEKTNIRITDAAGNLVHQAVARGGTYAWDLTNKGKRVASGIYFVLMTNEDGTDKATAKIAVVN